MWERVNLLFSQSRNMNRKEKLVSIISIFSALLYNIWLIFNIQYTSGWLLVVCELGFLSLILLKVFNHWTERHIPKRPAEPEGTLDVFLPIVNEPISLFENTLRAVININYKEKTVYILDDGGRSELEALARKYNVVYLSRENKPENYKAGNLNYGLEYSKGDFILVLDSDQLVVEADIAKDLLGYFKKPNVALVATKQSFYNLPEGDFNHDTYFYERNLPAKNADNAAISCGTGVFYRRSALKTIKGFQTWNIVEDLYTSYVLHLNGYTTEYINKNYTIGLAPFDLPSIYKQRRTWAADTLRIFFRKNPLIQRSLTLRQKCHYLETALSYIVSALCVPVMLALIAISLITNIYVIPASDVYLFLKVSSLCIPTALTFLLSNRSLSMTRAWTSLFPVYMQGLFLALRPNKPMYTVTRKTRGKTKRHIGQIWAHLVLISINSIALFWHLNKFGFSDLAIAGLFWTLLQVYWFAPFLSRGFGFVRERKPLQRRYAWTQATHKEESYGAIIQNSHSLNDAV